MTRFLKIALAAFLLLSPALAPAVAQAAPEIGKPAPDFSATDLDGKPVKLSDLKGKIVVLEWTNPECPFVHKHYDTGSMQQTQKTATAKGVEWISIVSSAPQREGYMTPEQAKAVLAEKGAAPSAEILDSSGEIGRLYDARTTPHMFVIDAAGTLVYAGAIDDKPTPNPATLEGAKNYVLAALGDLEAGRPVATAQTQPYGCSVKY